MITSVILANHSRFYSSVLLGNAAYDIALSVRGAQVYGLSTQSTGGSFNVGYGIHFTTGANTYLLFADNDRDHIYDNPGDTILKTYGFQRGYQIQKFCGVQSNGSEHCSNTGDIPFLDVAFLRPNPDAWILSSTGITYSQIKVTIRSGSDETRTVSVQSTGQITVSNP